MGEYIAVSSSVVLPSQDYLKPETLEYILDCYDNENYDQLPPPPIVRKHPTENDTFIAIDGHNLLAANEYLQRATEVYLADSASDVPPAKVGSNEEAVLQRTLELRKKFVSSVEASEKMKTEGFATFAELVELYPDVLPQ